MKNNDAWKPLSNFFYIPLILFSFSSILSSEILIDGELSEKEWQTAREINKFYEVFPFSLNDVSGNTRVLILDDEKGIYFGFINTQSNIFCNCIKAIECTTHTIYLGKIIEVFNQSSFNPLLYKDGNYLA